MADGLGRRHQWGPDTASSRRKGIQTGRGDFREIPDCAVLRELLPPPRLMLRRETLVCDTIEDETGIANLMKVTAHYAAAQAYLGGTCLRRPQRPARRRPPNQHYKDGEHHRYWSVVENTRV